MNNLSIKKILLMTLSLVVVLFSILQLFFPMLIIYSNGIQIVNKTGFSFLSFSKFESVGMTIEGSTIVLLGLFSVVEVVLGICSISMWVISSFATKPSKSMAERALVLACFAICVYAIFGITLSKLSWDAMSAGQTIVNTTWSFVPAIISIFIMIGYYFIDKKMKDIPFDTEAKRKQRNYERVLSVASDIIVKYGRLKQQGIITEEDFNEKRRQIFAGFNLKARK